MKDRNIAPTPNAVGDGVVNALTGLTGSVWPVAFSPDGQLVLTSFEYNSARLWETATGKPFATLIGHTHRIASAAFSPDARLVVTGSHDETARLWPVFAGT